MRDSNFLFSCASDNAAWMTTQDQEKLFSKRFCFLVYFDPIDMFLNLKNAYFSACPTDILAYIVNIIDQML